MPSVFLTGKRLWLRPLEPADLDGPYLSWLNDRETTRFLETGRFPVTRQALEESVQAAGRSKDSVLLAIVDRRTDRHVGNIKLGPINWVHRYGSVGLLIGEAAYRGKGYGREALELLARYAFLQLGLNKLTAGAYGDHAACLTLFQEAGFVIEGRQCQHLYREGRYHDKVLLGCVRERFLQRQAVAPARAARPARRRQRSPLELAEGLTPHG